MRVGLTADSVADLLGHVSDLVEGIRQETVCLQEVEGAEGEQLEGDANVAIVVEPVQHLHTVADGQKKKTMKVCTRQDKSIAVIGQNSLLVVRVSFPDRLQDVDLQLGCFSVFLQIFNDLQSDWTPSVSQETEM